MIRLPRPKSIITWRFYFWYFKDRYCSLCSPQLCWGLNGRSGYGNIKIHLAEILEEKNISLNQLSFRTEMQRTQLRNYRDNKIQRLDIDILKRLYYVLECSLTDLIEYIPPEETQTLQ